MWLKRNILSLGLLAMIVIYPSTQGAEAIDCAAAAARLAQTNQQETHWLDLSKPFSEAKPEKAVYALLADDTIYNNTILSEPERNWILNILRNTEAGEKIQDANHSTSIADNWSSVIHMDEFKKKFGWKTQFWPAQYSALGHFLKQEEPYLLQLLEINLLLAEYGKTKTKWIGAEPKEVLKNALELQLKGFVESGGHGEPLSKFMPAKEAREATDLYLEILNHIRHPNIFIGRTKNFVNEMPNEYLASLSPKFVNDAITPRIRTLISDYAALKGDPSKLVDYISKTEWTDWAYKVPLEVRLLKTTLAALAPQLLQTAALNGVIHKKGPRYTLLWDEFADRYFNSIINRRKTIPPVEIRRWWDKGIAQSVRQKQDLISEAEKSGQDMSTDQYAAAVGVALKYWNEGAHIKQDEIGEALKTWSKPVHIEQGEIRVHATHSVEEPISPMVFKKVPPPTIALLEISPHVLEPISGSNGTAEKISGWGTSLQLAQIDITSNLHRIMSSVRKSHGERDAFLKESLARITPGPINHWDHAVEEMNSNIKDHYTSLRTEISALGETREQSHDLIANIEKAIAELSVQSEELAKKHTSESTTPREEERLEALLSRKNVLEQTLTNAKSVGVSLSELAQRLFDTQARLDRFTTILGNPYLFEGATPESISALGLSVVANEGD